MRPSSPKRVECRRTRGASRPWTVPGGASQEKGHKISPLDIALVVLVAVAIWAVVELALTIRKARASVDEVTTSANETIAQVQPIIAKVDGMVDDLDPAMKQVNPLLVKAEATIDGATQSLDSLNNILGDVSTVTGTASAVTDTVSKGVAGAAGAVAGAVSKLVGKGDVPQARLEDAAGKENAEESPAPAQQHATAYVTYAPVEAETPTEAEKPEPAADPATAPDKQSHKPKHAAPVTAEQAAADGEENNA